MPGFTFNTGINGNTVSWIKNPNVVSGVYGYLATFGQLVGTTTTGQMAATYASRTNDTAFPYVCCAIPIAAVGVNDNTTHVQNSWVYYGTGARLAGTGSLVNEFDIANLGAVVDINPYTGPLTGSTLGLALQSGGEPATVGAVNPDSAALLIGPNGGTFRHGIVISATAIDPAGCGISVSCPAIDMAQGQEIRWARDVTDQYGSFVRGATVSNGVGIEMNDFGVIFKAGALPSNNNIIAQIIYRATPSVYPALSSNATSALFVAKNDNGTGDFNVELFPQGAGVVQFGYGFSTATTPGNFVAQRRIQVQDVNGAVFYIPAMTSAW